jgi:hypothetical protein
MTALDRLRETLARQGSVSSVSPQDQESARISLARAPDSRQENSNPPPSLSENLGFPPRGTDRTDKTLPRWIDRPDVVALVEDLADEGKKPGQISRTLGLSRAEIFTVFQRTGR